MTYSAESLLEIKRLREQRAESACARERRAHDAARVQVESAQRNLDDGVRDAREREAALYAALYRHPVRVAAIERVHAESALLRERVENLRAALQDAESRLAERVQALRDARAARAAAALRTAASQEMATEFMQETLRVAQRKAEREGDDMSGKKGSALACRAHKGNI